MVLGIAKATSKNWYCYVKASLEILGIGIGVKKVVLLMSAIQCLLELIAILAQFINFNHLRAVNRGVRRPNLKETRREDSP